MNTQMNNSMNSLKQTELSYLELYIKQAELTIVFLT